MRPNFQTPVDTVEQLVERGIRVYEQPGGEYWQQLFQSSPSEAYQKMGATMYFTPTYDIFSNLTLVLAEEGGWCQIAPYMLEYEIADARRLHPQGRGFWQSKEKLKEWRYLKYYSSA